jgi:hypothetical protein
VLIVRPPGTRAASDRLRASASPPSAALARCDAAGRERDHRERDEHHHAKTRRRGPRQHDAAVDAHHERTDHPKQHREERPREERPADRSADEKLLANGLDLDSTKHHDEAEHRRAEAERSQGRRDHACVEPHHRRAIGGRITGDHPPETEPTHGRAEDGRNQREAASEPERRDRASRCVDRTPEPRERAPCPGRNLREIARPQGEAGESARETDAPRPAEEADRASREPLAA